MRDRIRTIENYVRWSLSSVTEPDLRIAHDFSHVDRVRNWALRIARGEAVQDLELVEAAALLHDIGLTRVEVSKRGQHARIGAEIAEQFLSEHQLFSEEEIGVITYFSLAKGFLTIIPEFLLDLVGGPPVDGDLLEHLPLQVCVHGPENGDQLGCLVDNFNSVHTITGP